MLKILNKRGVFGMDSIPLISLPSRRKRVVECKVLLSFFVLCWGLAADVAIAYKPDEQVLEKDNISVKPLVASGEELVSYRKKQHVGSYLMAHNIPLLTADVFKHLTHLFYFSLAPNAEGQLGKVKGEAGHFTPLHKLPTIKKDLARIKSLKSNSRTKVFLVVGGWVQSDYFDEAAASPTARAALAKNIRDFCLEHGLDGVDLDWEPYKGELVERDYELLVKDIRAAFIGSDLKVSVTIGAHYHYLADEFEKYADFVQLMSYGRKIESETQVPLPMLEKFVNSWLEGGLSKDKLVVGLPAFSRPIVKSKPDSVSYKKIITDFNPAIRIDSIFVDGVRQYFNGVASIKKKSEYAKNNGLKGVMFWSLGQDVSPDHPKSLLRAVTGKDSLNDVVHVEGF